MKLFKNLTLVAISTAIILLGSTSAKAQPLPYVGDLLAKNGAVTLQVGASSPGVTNLISQKVITLPPRTSISFFPVMSGAGGASVSNVVIQLAVSPGLWTNNGAYGTNATVGSASFSTTPATGLQVITTLQGTTNIFGFQTLSYTNWDGARQMEIQSIYNYATNAVPPVVSNVFYSFQAVQ